jgi:hypothetical protein
MIQSNSVLLKTKKDPLEQQRLLKLCLRHAEAAPRLGPECFSQVQAGQKALYTRRADGLSPAGTGVALSFYR